MSELILYLISAYLLIGLLIGIIGAIVLIVFDIDGAGAFFVASPLLWIVFIIIVIIKFILYIPTALKEFIELMIDMW